jgi:hypothetical protein
VTSRLAAFALGLGLFALALPARADEPPPRFPPSDIRWKLITGGLAVTTVAYGVGLLATQPFQSVVPDPSVPPAPIPGNDAFLVPVAGPWIALAQLGCPSNNLACDKGELAARAIGTVFCGLIQGGGVAIAMEGVFATTEASAAKDAAKLDMRVGSTTMRPGPITTPGGPGVGLSGTF